jgi:hypothetical protein
VAKTYVRSKDVFINCPFDSSYRPIFNAIVFAVCELGFRARCALEIDDAGDTRLDKITRIIGECKYGIHDISATELNPAIHLPRFNMPLELGLFLGCKRYGSPSQRSKSLLILDREPYRYRNFISDVSGQDIHAHGADPNRAIIEVRNWLASKGGILPGGTTIQKHYARFVTMLPAMCQALALDSDELTFTDLSWVINRWLISTR